MAATFDEREPSIASHSLTSIANDDSEKSVSATSPFFFLSNGGCRERCESMNENAARHGVGARVRVSGAGKKGMRIGREGDSYSS